MGARTYLIKSSKESAVELFENNNDIPFFWYALLSIAKHFVKEKELICLKFLYEREIKFLIESTLKTVEYVKEDCLDILVNDIVTFDLEKHKADKQHNSIAEAGK